MKKNIMMRIASVMMVALLLSTCAISGTFAKYVTFADGTDSARVAKFGVSITANVEDQTFSNGYVLAGTAFESNPDDASVWNNTDALVAPGTAGSLVDFTVTGTPEVDVEVTYVADLTLTNWFIDDDDDGIKDPLEVEYCPLVFTVNGVEYYIGKNASIQTVADLEATVEAAIVAKNQTYKHNTDLSGTTVADDLDVSWIWNYEDTVIGHQTNANDTILGNQAADGFAATVTLYAKLTVTQVN